MFYTYIWLREDGTPYYVGKGTRYRGFTNSAHGVHRPIDSSRIILQEHSSEKDAFDAERFLIAYYGRKDLGTGCLRNLTDGGEGASGCIPTQEARQNMSRAGKGRRKSSEWVEKIRQWHLGRKRPAETCKRISVAMRHTLFPYDTILWWPRKYPRICAAVGCSKAPRSLGFCNSHYQGLRRQRAIRQTALEDLQPIQQEIF
jgi:hypothetical protein